METKIQHFGQPAQGLAWKFPPRDTELAVGGVAGHPKPRVHW